MANNSHLNFSGISRTFVEGDMCKTIYLILVHCKLLDILQFLSFNVVMNRVKNYRKILQKHGMARNQHEIIILAKKTRIVGLLGTASVSTKKLYEFYS